MTAVVRTAVLFGCGLVLAWPARGRAQPAGDADVQIGAVAAPQPVAHPWGGVYFRLGGALVKPVTSSRELELAGVDGPASLAVQNGPINGSGATVESATIFAGSIGWVMPTARRRLSLELVLGLPFTVKFQATGTLADTSIAPMALGIPTGVRALGPQLGEATAVPLVVTSVYQLTPGGTFRPYLGAGASVLFTRKAKVTNPLLIEVGHPELAISPAPGLVAQAGLDVRLWKSWYARLDVKFIALKAHAEVHHVEVKTPGLPVFDSVEVGTAKLDLWVNPLIVQAGVGCDFDIVNLVHKLTGGS